MNGTSRKESLHAIPVSQVLGCASLVLLLAGCSSEDEIQSPVRRIPVKSEIRSAEVAPIIALVRKGGTRVLRPEEVKSLNTWLGKELTEGRTTQDEVIGLFGKQFHDLDRPERDSVTSIQYMIGFYGHATLLQFDFDADSRVLTHWSVGNAICGFCPHVFVNNQRWRLEGKMLAGCVGENQAGDDVLLLPRLKAFEGRLHVKLSNLASESDYIDQVQLGAVGLDDAEMLDVGVDGELFVWRPGRDMIIRMQSDSAECQGFSFQLDPSRRNVAVVLQLRNTTVFETEMRGFVFGESKEPPQAALQIQFDEKPRMGIPPVGTKFYRRVVLPVPDGTRLFCASSRQGLWLVSRAWIGTIRLSNPEIHWQSPQEAVGPASNIGVILRDRDGRRMCLKPLQEARLTFRSPGQRSDARQLGYVLRMSGYYDFL